MSTEIDEQLKVLSEVSHDLANCFHRSYYFLELLSDALPDGDETSATTLARLHATVEEIETMVRSAIDYIRPVELRRLRIRMSDLVASLRQHVGLKSLEVGGDGDAGALEVEVDPARISEALSFLCKASIGDDQSSAPVVVELFGGDPVSLRIHGKGNPERRTRSDLPLALTARIARLHGGGLEIQDGDKPSLTLRLPVAHRETR